MSFFLGVGTSYCVRMGKSKGLGGEETCVYSLRVGLRDSYSAFLTVIGVGYRYVEGIKGE